MLHFIILMTLAFFVFVALISIWATYHTENKVLKYSKKKEKMVFHQALMHHPMVVMGYLTTFLITLTVLFMTLNVNLLDTDKTFEILTIVGWTVFAFVILVIVIMFIVHNRVPVIKFRLFKRNFMRIYKRNTPFYIKNRLPFQTRMKINFLQMRLYSKARIPFSYFLSIKHDMHVKFADQARKENEREKNKVLQEYEDANLARLKVVNMKKESNTAKTSNKKSKKNKNS